MAVIDVSKAHSMAVIRTLTQEVRMPLARAFGVVNFPTQELQVSEFYMNTVVSTMGGLNVSQVRGFAVAKGRTQTRKVRCWSFTLDGHDFYVLQLGDVDGTLVYDLTTGQWMDWQSPDLRHWRANCGTNWIGMGGQAFIDGADSKVVSGDDATGILWTLEPDQGYDQSTRESLPDHAFTRRVVGGVPGEMRNTQQVGAVYLVADAGEPQSMGTSVTLRTSDDEGQTWDDHGTLTVEPGDYNQEFSWRSLGVIRAPGKIFEITDDGGVARIDGLDMR